jgi:hypothetical protein
MLEYFANKNGAEKGDLIIIIGFDGLQTLEDIGKEEDELEDSAKLRIGSIEVTQSFTSGELGEWFHEEINKTFPTASGYSDTTCG